MPLRIVVVSHKYGNVAFSWNSHEKKLLINFCLRPCAYACVWVISSIIKIQFRWISQGVWFAVQQQKPRKSHLSHTHTLWVSCVCNMLHIDIKQETTQRSAPAKLTSLLNFLWSKKWKRRRRMKNIEKKNRTIPINSSNRATMWSRATHYQNEWVCLSEGDWVSECVTGYFDMAMQCLLRSQLLFRHQPMLNECWISLNWLDTGKVVGMGVNPEILKIYW